MKNVLVKISTFLMAIVVILSTMSFTFSMHYCGDTLVETTLFIKAKGCSMEMGKSSAEPCSITKKNCCDDKQLSIEGQDELQLTVDKISLKQQVFITSFVYTYTNLFEGFEKKAISYKEYKPPLVIRRIYKIDETYLI